MRKSKSSILLYVLWRLVSKDESQLAKEKEIGERKESMGLLLKNYSTITSHYRSQSQVFGFLGFSIQSLSCVILLSFEFICSLFFQTQGAFSLSRRGFHVEPGPREQAVSLSLSFFLIIHIPNHFFPISYLQQYASIEAFLLAKSAHLCWPLFFFGCKMRRLRWFYS